MPTENEIQFQIRPISTQGAWLTNAGSYSESAQLNLAELKEITQKVKDDWPVPLGETIRNPQEFPQLFELTKKRDALSDSVMIFVAMTVEAFINYYGVIRFGENDYQTHIERKGFIPKIKFILLKCDSISLNSNSELLKIMDKIAKQRSDLVHPKTKEVEGYLPVEDRPGHKIPEAAQEAVDNMNSFFSEFILNVPNAKHLIPNSINIA